MRGMRYNPALVEFFGPAIKQSIGDGVSKFQGKTFVKCRFLTSSTWGKDIPRLHDYFWIELIVVQMHVRISLLLANKQRKVRRIKHVGLDNWPCANLNDKKAIIEWIDHVECS